MQKNGYISDLLNATYLKTDYNNMYYKRKYRLVINEL